MSAENLQFNFFTDVPGGGSVVSALTKYNNAPHKDKNGTIDSAFRKEDFYFFDQVVKVSLTNYLTDVLNGIKRRQKEHQIRGGSASSGGTADAKSEDACERDLIEQFQSTIDNDVRLKIFTRYWLLKPLKQKIRDDNSLKGDIERVVKEFLNKNKAYFSGITEYDICDYLEIGYEGKCFNCGQTINSKESNYTCACGAIYADKHKFYEGLGQLKAEFSSLHSICNTAASCFDATKLVELFNQFALRKSAFEKLIDSFMSAYGYSTKNSWFIQNDPIKTIDRFTKEIYIHKTHIAKKAKAANHGEFVCWDTSMIPLINSHYDVFLSNADWVCSFVENNISGREIIRFRKLLTSMHLANQKLFLAQLFMPNCDSRDNDYRLVYWRIPVGSGRKNVDISFCAKNESELFVFYQELDTLYYDDHVNQLLILEQYLLSMFIERLNIDVDQPVRSEIKKLTDSRR